MTDKELLTYQHFISSNNSFSYAVENYLPFKPDIYIKVELLILHIRHIFSQANQSPSNDIISALLNGNYYIEDERIVIMNQSYTIEELNDKVELKDSNYITQIHFPTTQPINVVNLTGKCQVINITDHFFRADFTLQERGIIFERTCKVDNDTLPFINEMRCRFIELMDNISTNIINGTIDYDEDIYYKVLSSYLTLYPFMDYAKGKLRIPFEKLSLPLNEIGLTKVKYSDEYLDTLKHKIMELRSQAKRITNETDIILSSGFISNKHILDLRNRKTIFLDAEISRLLFEYNDYSHTPDVLNPIFFEFIYEALLSGNVIINRFFADPVIKFFTIEKDEVTSYIAIHLATLIRVFDPSILTSQEKKLEYTTT